MHKGLQKKCLRRNEDAMKTDAGIIKLYCICHKHADNIIYIPAVV